MQCLQFIVNILFSDITNISSCSLHSTIKSVLSSLIWCSIWKYSSYCFIFINLNRYCIFIFFVSEHFPNCFLQTVTVSFRVSQINQKCSTCPNVSWPNIKYFLFSKYICFNKMYISILRKWQKEKRIDTILNIILKL